ncbi:ketosamine-3-kinase-like isoform X3 [Palaemon carinicauda]|uniref:ketosamine-3-kinase-like isoform X3 n=1 Tax=Palaemon carinicauda TaxID=392227 RepID=UPI0035B652C8
MTSKMYDTIREALGTSRFVATGQMGGGCINEGEVYEVDHKKVYLKRSSKEKARAMFDGEFKSPKATKATGTVRVPTPRIVVDDPVGGAVLCVEYPDMVQFESAHGNAREAAGRARAMFDGEFKSPKAMKATGTVRVPTPRIVVDDPTGGAVLCLEYRDMAQFESAHGNAREAAGRISQLKHQILVRQGRYSTESSKVRRP